ncbi:ribonuclease P protein component [Cyanobium sp. Copco_Reservoir_LC18]|uniref:ribonuclease P protein component n=1 Tax=Cyanobium sp. Copco_Reservoir_LC18 TaxID=1328305 RepID=UPI0013591A01|nr:ribonuclease P protein component [Cyanobium sp. Copco_Reservoir_LC18]KAF0654971.1 ribonuclease P protein component [Cyanobium sp. Copco_Reservoir_LC18]
MALPQQHRLKGRRVFDRLYRQGRRYQGPGLLLRVLAADPSLLPPGTPPTASPWRCGIVVSTKVSKLAVRRNRLRRLFHDHLRRHPPTPDQPLWLLITLKPGCLERSEDQLLGECAQLLRQAGLLLDPGGQGGEQTRDQ